MALSMEGESAPPAAEGRTCPECGETMEHGYLAGTSRAPFGGLRWFQQADFHFTVFGGEELVPSAWLNANTYVGGFRCRRCHLLMLRY